MTPPRRAALVRHDAATDAAVRRGTTEEPVVAREVPEGAERERLWRMVTEAFPLYATYQRRTERIIPLFVLEPVTEGA